MTRYAKIIDSIAVLIFFCSCSERHVEYVLSDIALKLEIPASFKVLNAEQADDLNKKGLKILEDVNHKPIDASQTKTLITAGKNELNYFTVTIIPYDLHTGGSFMENVRQVDNLLYTTLRNKIPDATIDTVKSKKNIGGLEFKEFHMIVQIKGKITMHLFLLSRYYQGYHMGISYSYIDDITRKQMESILESCKFTY